ncbi:MAG: cytochrome c biogenesis protein ResB [Akkermansiaceae bacterium]|jgi:hypothetical protein
MSELKKISWGVRIFRFFASFQLAVVCLSLLFLLTFFGTIEQKWNGLYGTIQKYFDLDSFIVIPTLASGKVIPIILPGAYWVIVVLSINMFLGGLLKARKGWKKAGTLVSHFAILFMLIAGAVSSVSKQEGKMIVYQGKKSDYAQMYHDFDIEVFRYDENGDREAPAIIDSKFLSDLEPKHELQAGFAKFDFGFEIDGFEKISELALAGPDSKPQKGEEVLDGFFIAKAEKNVKEEGMNMPGCYVTVKGKDGKAIQRLILWGGNPFPVSFSYEGSRYGVCLLRKIWPMPFEVELHKTVGEYHPNTQIPRWFQSDITKVSDGEREDYMIVMNEPARHGGYTIFQADWSDNGDTPYSGFAIVKNPSDKWPEYALYIATVGLLFHFLMMLWRFAGGSSRKKTTPKTP